MSLHLFLGGLGMQESLCGQNCLPVFLSTQAGPCVPLLIWKLRWTFALPNSLRKMKCWPFDVMTQSWQRRNQLFNPSTSSENTSSSSPHLTLHFHVLHSSRTQKYYSMLCVCVCVSVCDILAKVFWGLERHGQQKATSNVFFLGGGRGRWKVTVFQPDKLSNIDNRQNITCLSDRIHVKWLLLCVFPEGSFWQGKGGRRKLFQVDS